MRMGFWAIILLALPLTAFLMFAKDVLILLGQQPDLAEAASRFVRPLSSGLVFSLGYQVLRNYAAALERPNASLWVMLATFLFNAIADYALIFGHFGMPRLGLTGSGIASASSYAFSFVAMVAVVFADETLRKVRIFRRFLEPDWRKFAELFHLGVPIGVTTMFESMLFLSAALVMGTFGTDSLAAHQVALNIPSLTFMVPLGIAMAATVRVGLAAGAGDLAGARRAGFTAAAIGTGFMSVAGLILALFPRPIAALWFAADNAANAAVLALASQFLLVAAAFQIFDGIQVVASLSLRGLKDASRPMWLAGAAYWLFGFPLCIGLGVGLGWQGFGVWLGLAFALMAAAILLGWRFVALTRRRRG